MTAPNPNQLNQPNPNLLPQFGEIQPPQEWPVTAHAINESLRHVRESTQQYDTTVNQINLKHSHRDQNYRDMLLRHALKGRNFVQEREQHLNYIRHTAAVQDTEQILGLLLGEQNANIANRGRADNGLQEATNAHNTAMYAHQVNDTRRENLRRYKAGEAPDPRLTSAERDRLAELKAERMHHKGNSNVVSPLPIVGRFLNSHLNYALNIRGWRRANRQEAELTDLQQQYDAIADARKVRDTSVTHPHSRSASGELMARVAANRASQDRAKLGESATITADLFTEINQRREASVREVNAANDRVRNIYDQWGLGQQAPNYYSSQDARDALYDMGQALNELSPRDPAYRAAFAIFVRQTFRLEERENLDYANNPSTAPMPGSSYTAGGGLRVHAGTPNEAVFFEDGSVARPDGNTLNSAYWQRRDPAGRPINPRPAENWPPVTEQLGVEPLQDVFNAWENCRTPETAARLNAEFNFHIANVQTQERNCLSVLDTIAERMTEVDDIIRDQGAIAADTSRSAEDRQAARDAISQAATEKATLIANQTQTQQNLEIAHSRLTPMIYGRERLTVTDDGNEDTPTMATYGTATVYRNMTLYARENGAARGGMVSGLWGIRPDGSSVRAIRNSAGSIIDHRVYDPAGNYRGNASNF